MSNFYKMNGSKYAINHDFFTNITYVVISMETVELQHELL